MHGAECGAHGKGGVVHTDMMRRDQLMVMVMMCSVEVSAFSVGTAALCPLLRTHRPCARHQPQDALRRLPRTSRLHGAMAWRAQDCVSVGDVVEYALPEGGGKTVGLVEDISAEHLSILPLVRREGVGEECYVDETQPYAVVSSSDVRFINTYPSQRVAWSTASPHHNPHGEESEDVYLIEDELSPDCSIPTKLISDT